MLHTILDKMNLHPDHIKIMQIENLDTMENMELIMNAVESEIMENETSAHTDSKQKKEEKKMTIEYFGSDLTKEYKDGFIDPVIGRAKEIDQIIYTLLRKTKNNPLLIGEAGVGKTAVVE